MEITKQDYELIQKYLSQGLSSTEFEYFQERSKLPAFKKELVFQSQLIDQLDAHDNKALRTFLKEEVNSPSNVYKLMLGLIIITILVIAMFFVVKTNLKIEEPIAALADQNFQMYPTMVLERGVENQIELDEAMLAYANKDFTLAQSLFKTLTVDKPDLNIYSANILMLNGDFEQAFGMFEKIDASDNVSLRQNVEWYKSLCLLQLGRIEEAKADLNSIEKEEGHLFERKAKLLLKKLNS